MYRILEKEQLNASVFRMVIEAPSVARKAEAGQFIILRTDENGERIPLTVADYDRERGSVTVVFSAVGATTIRLSSMSKGESLQDFVGPLGTPTETEGLSRVCIVSGGVGAAIAYPVAKKLASMGCCVHSVVGFRSRELVVLEKEFEAVSDRFLPCSDDGTWGEKALVTNVLQGLLEAGEKYDRVITIGPLPMMKYVSLVTKRFSVPTVASMNPIMIDGTGMCGGCRLTVGGVTKFACVDGPEFDAHLVDFDEAIARSSTYREFEGHAREQACNLFLGEGNV
ncbi:MAG: sulfide/dihydroorotate dehydrogenase-like FAD/NAD-binding protein [Clostridia bacterium]|nr:sulfide/dihydroorotate dehydrogenase-like FAD/NAD-binding protein [Clostridia bacterium]